MDLNLLMFVNQDHICHVFRKPIVMRFQVLVMESFFTHRSGCYPEHSSDASTYHHHRRDHQHCAAEHIWQQQSGHLTSEVSWQGQFQETIETSWQ